MKTIICKVVGQAEPFYVQSKKQENGQLAKCYIRLRGRVPVYHAGKLGSV